VGSKAGRKLELNRRRIKRELKLECRLRDLQTHDKKERNKGNKMEARSIRRSKLSSLFTLYKYLCKEESHFLSSCKVLQSLAIKGIKAVLY
jgi:hypothetical protein